MIREILEIIFYFGIPLGLIMSCIEYDALKENELGAFKWLFGFYGYVHRGPRPFLIKLPFAVLVKVSTQPREEKKVQGKDSEFVSEPKEGLLVVVKRTILAEVNPQKLQKLNELNEFIELIRNIDSLETIIEAESREFIDSYIRREKFVATDSNVSSKIIQDAKKRTLEIARSLSAFVHARLEVKFDIQDDAREALELAKKTSLINKADQLKQKQFERMVRSQKKLGSSDIDMASRIVLARMDKPSELLHKEVVVRGFNEKNGDVEKLAMSLISQGKD